MTGFSAEWLALREPVDHLSRSENVRDAVVAHFVDAPVLRVTDLGCGTGSNLRALAPCLSAVQEWRLVDYDPALLRAAAEALTEWADTAQARADGVLELKVGGKSILVSFEQADLAAGLEEVLAAPIDLVTAAAFFDLVSGDWIARFVAASVHRLLPLYTVLTYDGREAWHPPHPADADVLAAFHAHQATDKGFGVAAGPAAGPALVDAYRAAGWKVVTGDSPWQLGPPQSALIGALAEGAAGAVAETGRVAVSALDSWLVSRRIAPTCEIGHIDVFALPPSK